MLSRALITGLLALACLPPAQARAVDYPAQDGFVTDTANLLSSASEATLESNLQRYQDESSIQVAVASVNSLQGEHIERYAQNLGNRWGVGNAEANNGVVIVIAKDDRELAVWFGDGYPKPFSNSTASYLVDRVLIPRLKQGQPERGIVDAVAAVQQRLAAAGYTRAYWDSPQQHTASAPTSSQQAPVPVAPAAPLSPLLFAGGLLALVIVATLLVVFLVQRSRRRSALSKCARTVERLQHQLEDVRRLQDGLKENFPASVWEEPLARLRTDTLERVLFADAAKLPTGEIEGLLTLATAMSNSAGAVVTLAQQAPIDRQESKKMFAELPRQMDVVRAGFDHPDVLPETKAALDKARADLADRQAAVAGREDNEVDWVAVHADLLHIAGEVSSIQLQAADNKDRAVRARTEIPQMLQALPGQIETLRRKQGGQYEDVDAALQAADEIFTRAQSTPFKDNDISSLLILHSMLETAQHRCVSATQAVEAHRQAASGGSFGGWSGGGSSGSFRSSSGSGGSFGGRGGGGASGRW
jgi:uncharacterized membrane protein YgcG